MVQSRIGTTKTFVDFVRDLKDEKPEVFVSMSGVSKFRFQNILKVIETHTFQGYYQPDPVKEYTEASEGGDYDFLSRLARDWEQASEPIETKFNVRRVVLRAGRFTRWMRSSKFFSQFRSSTRFNWWDD